MPAKRFMLFQLIPSGISQILIICAMEDAVSSKIAVIRNSDSVLVLVPACGRGTDGWQQGARGRAMAAASAWPHPSLLSCVHTGLLIPNTEEGMSPRDTKSWLLWGLPDPAEQGQAGRGREFGLGTRHQSCSQWVCLPRRNWKTDVGVTDTSRGVWRNAAASSHFGLNLKICNSSAWDLPLETSWKYCGNCTGDGEAIVVHSGQNQREKGGRETPGSLVLALDRRKLSHVYKWAALSTQSLWGHVFVVACLAIPPHWACSPPEWASLKRKDTSQLSTEVISVGEAPCTAPVRETHFSNAFFSTCTKKVEISNVFVIQQLLKEQFRTKHTKEKESSTVQLSPQKADLWFLTHK